MEQAKTFREYDGWFLWSIVHNRIETADTHLPLDEEYWLALRHPAEVQSAGSAILTSSNPSYAGLPQSQKDQLWRGSSVPT